MRNINLAEVIMENELNKADVVAYVHSLGVNLVGVTSVARWDEFDEVEPAYRPKAIWQEAKSVIVIGLPVFLPTVESTPSINYTELYTTSNILLDQTAYRLALYLTEHGHGSIFLPRDGYGAIEVLVDKPAAAFSQVFAAKYAGLGTVGFNHTLLHPKYGPRVRYGAVFTTLELESDPVYNQELCIHCRLCQKACPSQAFMAGEDDVIAHMDKKACAVYHRDLRNENRYPCGVCIKVCPVGEDRKIFKNKNAALYLQEREALQKDPEDPRYAAWVHLRRHGSKGERIY